MDLHRWQKFYTAAGTDGTDKFHLCRIPALDDPGVVIIAGGLVLLVKAVRHNKNSSPDKSVDLGVDHESLFH